MSASHRVSLEPVFILHRRAYRETSLILECLTVEHGRVGVVARGGRGPRSRLAGLLQPFQPLLMSWQGRGELATLTGAEAAGRPLTPPGGKVFSGFYVNELMLRLVRRGDAVPGVFALYRELLADLARRDATEEEVLRPFEKALLDELGYGLLLDHEADTGRPVEAGVTYRYELEHGPVRAGAGSTSGRLTLAGEALLALSRGDPPPESARGDVKRLMRAALSLYLGDAPLKSRQLYARFARANDRIPEGDEDDADA